MNMPCDLCLKTNKQGKLLNLGKNLPLSSVAMKVKDLHTKMSSCAQIMQIPKNHFPGIDDL